MPTIHRMTMNEIDLDLRIDIMKRISDVNVSQPLMSDKSASLIISGLMGRGFTLEQASIFLPEAGHTIITALKDNGGMNNTESVISGIDVSSLALKTGIEQSKVKDGLKYVLPGIVEQLSGTEKGILGKVKSFI